jgi:DNA polymerase-3 subunit delta'
MFNHIMGNQKVKDYLTRTVNRRMIGNSLLFAGPDGIGKSLFAEAFAKMIICQDDSTGAHKSKIESGNHPDIHVYRPEGKIGMHSIGSMRLFNEEVYLAPFEAKWKVFIIHEADRMLSYSANALLKTFEEPAPDTVIILISSTPSALLPTVLSRCRTIHFQPLSKEDILAYMKQCLSKSDEEARIIASMAQGSIGQAARLANEGINPVRTLLLDALAKAKFNHYKELTAIAAELAESIDAGKKEMESEVRKILFKGTNENLSAAQKQALEKEVEGAVTMHAMQEAYALFEMILAWYRDLHLLSLKGNPSRLLHSDYGEKIRVLAEKGRIIPLEDVQKAIAETRLTLERSTSLQICLENLFLKLNLLQ